MKHTFTRGRLRYSPGKPMSESSGWFGWACAAMNEVIIAKKVSNELVIV